jgi:hypothetical protein
VKRYQNITPDRMPEWYVQKLWGLYDVPDYVRNFFNTTVIAYSGELDKQRAAAEVMVEAFKGEGRELTHLIGPKVEHKYEPETLKELLKRLNAVVGVGRKPYPTEVHFQTRTLRYPEEKWIRANGLEEHWKDSRIDAEKKDGAITLQTTNVSRLAITLPPEWANSALTIDGQPLGRLMESPVPIQLTSIHPFGKQDGRWKRVDPEPLADGRVPIRAAGDSTPTAPLRKRPGAQGPIDDAFMSSFLVVTPSGKSKNAAFQAWCDAELSHFRNRWRALMRGDIPEVRDLYFGGAKGNIILWGDPDTNEVMRSLMPKLPVKFQGGKWTVGNTTYDGNRFVPTMIFPRPEGNGYIVLNSGLTFREAHDRTNSQQNPKLPDWAIIDITQPPDANSPGRIHDADFFDEAWQLKRQPKPATE